MYTRRLDLGSGKITPAETRGVPHHLLDVCEPATFSPLGGFSAPGLPGGGTISSPAANSAFSVGGTGLYVDAVTEGYALSDVKPDLAYREELEALSTPELYRMLTAAEPGTAVDPMNRHRVMRRLEKLHDGDAGHGERVPRYRVLKLGVSWPRETLCRRIDERLARRMDAGLAEEVRGLLNAGVTPAFLRKLGLEYRYVSAWLTGEIPSEEEMLTVLAREIKRFAKRQMTWFRRDPRIVWLDMAGDPAGQAGEAIDAFLASADE